MNILSERLKQERKNSKLTQEQVSKMLNVTRPAYTQYETGATTPTIETLVKLANIYKVSMDYLSGRY